MKRKRIYLIKLLLIFLSGAVYSCSNEKPEFSYKQLAVNQKQALVEGQEPTCEVQIQTEFLEDTTAVARKINEALIKQLYGFEKLTPQAATDSFIVHYMKQYRQNLKELYLIDARNNIRSDWYNYSYLIKTERSTDYPGALCYTINQEIREGGAQVRKEKKTLCVDWHTGNPIHLADLFRNGSTALLQDKLRQKLMEQYQCSSITELRGKKILCLTDIYPTENFLLHEKSITFIYNPDELATYDQGIIEVTLLFKDIEELLKE